MENLNKTYDPKSFEDRIYGVWKEKGYFTPERDPDKKPYTIVMPPPNVTGNLHLGHAMNNTLQDILIRWRRMQGHSALWVPGTDHASISTEARVVAKIESEGKSKAAMGREAFLEESWEWTRKYGGNIKHQLEKLGVSCDWSRDSFTLDDNLSHAVEEVFIRMYEDGLIYQGDRIVNWCISCGTAVSDAEVEHVDEHGHLWHIRYPFEDGEGYIEIATTRPETLLGDLAVAVDPEDERYSDLVGKTLILPLVERKIPLIADAYVDKSFGSGAVKITPSHDPNDYEVGQRHNLGQCVVINEDGTIAEGYGPYSGMDRYAARKAMLKDLEAQGLLVRVEDHDHAVGHCERCGTVIEPLISKQWFVKMETLAKPALEAYKNGELTLIPDRLGKTYTNWLENIRDWCISRQLWWGHRLPVYYCESCKKVVVSRERPDVCSDCGSDRFVQDEDTLDTWFSSALWPFSTLGWPEPTEDFNYFFPTNVLVTGYDIIFFWVIRMVFSSLYNTGKLPFDHVYFTGLIRDSQGRKMSKSLNNGVDPIEVIDKYGADALRFTLVTGNTPGNDMRYYDEKVEANRNFANKLWNASRFVLMNTTEEVTGDLTGLNLEAEDKWILSRLNAVVKEVTAHLDKFEIGLAAQTLYDYTWNEFCDWYIEFVKVRLYGIDDARKATAQNTLVYVLKAILKLLHPFMPFITEEIFSYLPEVDRMLIMESWPIDSEAMAFPVEEKRIDIVVEAITAIRNARAEMGIVPSKKAQLIFVTQDEFVGETVEGLSYNFMTLAQAEGVSVEAEEPADLDAMQIVQNHYKIFIPLEGLVDYDKELERLRKEEKNLIQEIQRATGKLNNPGFVNKAPDNVVQMERDKLEKFERMLQEVQRSVGEIEAKIR